ncbi:hypothetical protein BCT63_14680 [Vibrio kanaloae]|nr:hypothetical protein BCT63_14680 [Vibrio kanaloae]
MEKWNGVQVWSRVVWCFIVSRCIFSAKLCDQLKLATWYIDKTSNKKGIAYSHALVVNILIVKYINL